MEGAFGVRPSVVARPRASRRRGRAFAVALLALFGIACLGAGTAAIVVGAGMAREEIRDNGLERASASFAFAKQAWRAIPVDQVFPPTVTTRDAAPEGRAVRVFTRIGVAPPTACTAAFTPSPTRLIAGRRCGPVLRADYTDATESLVTTVGVALLDTSPAQQRRLHDAVADSPDAVGPRLVAFPGTAAAALDGRRPLAAQVEATADRPYLFFAVTTFSDGRQASDDPGSDAPVLSGAKFMAAELIDLMGGQVEEGESAVRLGRLP